MEKLQSLENVNALALPAKVLVLLSKYAQYLRAHNGTILKLSSLRVFKHIHRTCQNAQDPKLNSIYQQLLHEVNIHIESGIMYTNDVKESMLRKKINKKSPLLNINPRRKHKEESRLSGNQ